MVNIGFPCAKNTLCALNVVYMMGGLFLIVVADWGKSFGIAASIPIIGGMIAVGVFLLLISIMGLVGTLKHHQILLFFYTVILIVLFVVQFGISCSCLILKKDQQEKLLTMSWEMMSNDTRLNLEHYLDCCGLINNIQRKEEFNMDVRLCTSTCKVAGNCFTCGDIMLHHASVILRFLGGFGLFFSFSEVLGVWLTMRYRNQKDPHANASDFS